MVTGLMCSYMGQAFGCRSILPEKQQLFFVMQRVSLCTSVVGEKGKSRRLYQRFSLPVFLGFQDGNRVNLCSTHCVVQEHSSLRRQPRRLVLRRVCCGQESGNRVFFVFMILIENLPKQFFLILKIESGRLRVYFKQVILILLRFRLQNNRLHQQE
jgi:hypothetical protein